MPIVAAQLVAQISAQGVEKTKSDLASVGQAVSQQGGFIRNALGGAFSLASNLAGQALRFLGGQLVDSVKLAMNHQQIMQQTAQAIKSTGDASGMTANQIGNLATSLSQMTPFSRDTIQNGENLLLTFTGIGKKTFPDATQAMLDMAQAMHQGPEQGAIMLGKALNDPTTGLTALTRVGVTFSDQEKEQIKVMMAHHDVAGAQKVMLHELETEFGGSAKAAGQTFGGQLQILKNRMDNLKETIGTAILPILSQFAGWIENNVMPVLAKFGDWFAKNAAPVIGKFAQQLGTDVLPILKKLGDFITSDVAPALGKFGDLIGHVFGGMNKGGGSSFLSTMGHDLQQVGKILLDLSPGVNLFQALSRHSQDLGKWFQTSVVPAFKQAEPGFKNLGDAIAGLLPAMRQIADIVHTTFQKAFDALLPVFEKAVPLIIKIAGIIADGLGSAIKFLTPYIVQAISAIGKFADEIAQRVAPIINQWIDQLSHDIDLFLKTWNAVWPYLAPILKGVWDEIIGVVKIAWAIVSGIIKIGLDLLSGNWKQAWQDFKDMLAGIWDGIKTYFQGVWEIIKGIFSGAINGIIALAQHLYEELIGHSIIPDLVNGIEQWLGSLGKRALGWAGDMITGFVDGIKGGIDKIGDAVGQVASTISSHLHFSKPDIGPLADADQWMPDFLEMLSTGINSNLAKIKGASLNIAASISGTGSPGSLSALPAWAQIAPASLQSAAPAAQASQGIPVVFEVDGRQFARAMLPAIVDRIRYSVGTHGL